MTISEAELLDLIDAGEALDATSRAMLLWRAMRPGLPTQQLWAAPLGARDRALLELRRERVGPTIELGLSCTSCEEQLEFQVPIEAVLVDDPGLDQVPFAVTVGDWEAQVEVASSATLRLLGERPELDPLAPLLRELTEGGEARTIEALPDALRAAIDKELSERDPQGDLRFELACSSCEEKLTTVLDPATVVWAELTRQARLLEQEVAVLAQVYHWSEADILAMPVARRRRYLALIEEQA